MSTQPCVGKFQISLVLLSFLPSANIVCEGYVFTPVCHSVHRGGVCLSACWDTHTQADTRWADTPRQTPTASPWAEPPLPSACWDTQCPVHAAIDMTTAADGTHPIHSFWVVISNGGLKLSKLLIHTLVKL